MVIRGLRTTAALTAALILAGCDSSSRPVADWGIGVAELDAVGARCVMTDPRRAVGAGLDATGTLDVESPALAPTAGPCAQNSRYRIGTGLHDVTGVIADTASPAWVNPQQVFSALHTRVYARAFAIESPCNGRRVMFVSIDTGLMSRAIRQAVLAEIDADARLKERYNGHNVMLSVTHTHSDPNTGIAGDNTGFAVLVSGIVAAIKNADTNLAAHPVPGEIGLSFGELLNTNINRSKPAFLQNAEAERQRFTNARGEQVQVNKQMVQLELYREPRKAVGLINWFGVHPTVIGPDQPYVSGDVKGYASLGLERLMGTDYRADAAAGTFVGAFAQADEGDSSPNIFIEDFPYPDPRRGGGETDLDSNAISGIKQLARALELLGQGEAVAGPVDYQFRTVAIDNITIEDPVVLASLNHPPELDDAIKRTCSGALGASFGAGAEDGPGPTVEGLKCGDDPDLLNAALADIATLQGARFEGFPGGWPAETIPGHVLSAAVMCNVRLLPPALGDFSCQAEKPVLLPRGGSALPFQLLRIGQFAVLGIPWEVTTVSARRLRSLLMTELAPVGVRKIVIAGLVNDYVHYLTTREEYSAQHYEGASTLYGPWTHAAVAQEALKLARAMRAGEPHSEPVAVAARSDLSLSPGPSEAPHRSGAPGTVMTQPPASVNAGERVVVEFVAGHPRNDLRLQESYAYVERLGADGGWHTVSEDRDPSLIYDWRAQIAQPAAFENPLGSGGSAQVIWSVPRNTAAGTYRIRIAGGAKVLSDAVQHYEATSEPFTVSGPSDECP